jgi:Zn finger protein HypA/HybF involved in hydrogenase expression
MSKSDLRERVLEALENDELLGFCLACGDEYPDPLEPDAREIECPACGKFRVFGAEECLLWL